VIGDWAPKFETPVKIFYPEGQIAGGRLRLDDDTMHCPVSGRSKYAWHIRTGQGLLLEQDPQELHDLLLDDDTATQAMPWRQQLIELLPKMTSSTTPEGLFFSR